MSNDKMYSVKEVLEICSITRAFLYYYEERGLIGSVRNQENNYRYFTEAEVFKISFIKECTEIGFDFTSIEALIKDNSMKTLRKVIDRSINQVRAEMNAAYAKYIRSLERYNTMREATYTVEYVKNDTDIKIVQVPAKSVLFYEYTGSFFDESIEYLKESAFLDRLISKYECTKVSPRMFRFFGHFDPVSGYFDHEDHKIRACYQISESIPEADCYEVIPAFNAVSVIHTGDYNDSIAETYQSLFKFAHDHDLLLSEDSMEEQLIDSTFGYDNKDNLATRIYIPIVEKDSNSF